MRSYQTNIHDQATEGRSVANTAQNNARSFPAVPVLAESQHINTPVQRKVTQGTAPTGEQLPTPITSTNTTGTTAPIQRNKIKRALAGGGIGLTLGGIGAAALATAAVVTNPWLLGGMVLAPALMGGMAGYFSGRNKKKESNGRVLENKKQDAPHVPVDSLHGTEAKPANIPNLMHFIWLGGALPAKRNETIQHWKQAAKGCKVWLWLDANSSKASADQLGELQRAGIELHRVEELHEESEAFAKAQSDLPTKEGEKVKGGAAGALSDLARLEILKLHGGHYMDSDNRPGKDAAAFTDMQAPMGVRLGWDKLEHSENFSNDAISATPNNDFIERYRKAAYTNLYSKPKTVEDINSTDPKRVKESVMNSTGPEAMAGVPLPIKEEHARGIVAENDYFKEKEGKDHQESMDTPSTNLTIRNFPQNRYIHNGFREQPEAFSPAMNNYFQDLAYTGELFSRGSDNSWVPPAKDAESKKDD